MNRSGIVVASVLLATLLGGCAKDGSPLEPEDGVLSDGTITVLNDENALASQVLILDQEVLVDSTGIPSTSLGKTAAIRLRLRAEVTPPSSGGQILQATHVALRGSYAYVSYNMRGETYLGAIDVFDVSSKTRPRLVSRAVLQGTDFSSVYAANSYLYLAGATSDTGFAFPAIVEEIQLSRGKLTLQRRRAGVPSYVATDVSVASGKVYATSGSGGPGTGGLTVLDLTTFTPVVMDAFLDARSVSLYSSWVVVLSGSPATIRLYNASTSSFVKNINVGGATIPASKSTVKVLLSRAFVAAGEEGMKIVNLLTDTVVDSLAAPVVPGLDPSLTVTNAVSVNRDLVFMANGEAGVYVAESPINLETSASGATNLTLQGKLSFGTRQSANFVASESDLLFIATGLGGLKIVEVQ